MCWADRFLATRRSAYYPARASRVGRGGVGIGRTRKRQVLTPEAQAANRLKDEFLAVLSHELRVNPRFNLAEEWCRKREQRALTRSDPECSHSAAGFGVFAPRRSRSVGWEGSSGHRSREEGVILGGEQQQKWRGASPIPSGHPDWGCATAKCASSGKVRRRNRPDTEGAVRTDGSRSPQCSAASPETSESSPRSVRRGPHQRHRDREARRVRSLANGSRKTVLCRTRLYRMNRVPNVAAKAMLACTWGTSRGVDGIVTRNPGSCFRRCENGALVPRSATRYWQTSLR